LAGAAGVADHAAPQRHAAHRDGRGEYLDRERVDGIDRDEGMQAPPAPRLRDEVPAVVHHEAPGLAARRGG
jgi:hypothetical protein